MQYDFDEVIERRNTRSLKWDAVGKFVGNADALPMWVADMDFRSPQPVIEAVLARARTGVYGYPALPPEFGVAVADWQQRRHDWRPNPKDILHAPGVIPAIAAAVQTFAAPGEGVIIQRPVYYPFFEAIENNGRRVLNNPLILRDGQYAMDFDDLERLAAREDAKLLILSNPHNPVGRVFTRAELERLDDICRRNGVVVLSDEIHADLVYSGHAHTPLASLGAAAADNTITAVSASKTFNLAGLRAAAIIVSNPARREALEKTFWANGSGLTTAFGIDACIAAYTFGDEYLAQLLAYLEQNSAFLADFLRQRLERIRLIRPEGTYLMWLDCRGLGLTDAALDQYFTHSAGVACDKGVWFGPEGSGFMRMNIACPRSLLQTALTRLADAQPR